jgi:hypothetical protein
VRNDWLTVLGITVAGIGGSDMSPALYVAPWNLITPTAATFEEAKAAPHGNPSSAPFINVKIVKGGGQSCH